MDLRCIRGSKINFQVNSGRNGNIMIWRKDGNTPKWSASEGTTTLGFLTSKSSRRADFETLEYACIIHIIGDLWILDARQQKQLGRTKKELDTEPGDPWDDNIAPLFNDNYFKSLIVDGLTDGVTRSDIIRIDTYTFICDHDSSFRLWSWNLRSWNHFIEPCLLLYE